MRTSAGLFLLAALALAMALPMANGVARQLAERAYVERTELGGTASSSDAVRTGNTVYIAGHLGVDPATCRAPAALAAEARLLLDGLNHTLEAAGLRMDDLVAVTVFSTNAGLDETFNAVYRTYFHGHLPAQAFVGADRLHCGARFEVVGVAVKAPRWPL